MIPQALIKIPARDIRASRRGVRWGTHRIAWIGVLSFLDGIGLANQGRYGRKSAADSPLERVFRRAIHSTLYSTNFAMHVAPKYAFAFHRQQPIGHHYHVRDRRVERIFQSRPAAERRGPMQIVSLLDRVTEHYRRVDHVSHRKEMERVNLLLTDRESKPIPAKPFQTPGSQPIEMILKRESAAGQTSQQDTLKNTVADTPGRFLQKEKALAQSQRSFSLAEFSPNEVQHLTDQVVNTLDHRITAMRERLGKA